MSGTIRIALDAMGGDFGPDCVIPAAAQAYAKRPNLRFMIFGDAVKINPLIAAHPDLRNVSEIIHTDVFVDNHEKPSSALRKGKNSSLRLAIDAVETGKADCIISAGNTGALMATAKLVFRTLPGIHRPAIAGILPNIMGNRTIMLDVGANVVADAENLVQFAVLGSCFAKVLGVNNPMVGILNIGSEDTKGHETLHQAAAILSQAKFPGRYKGFVEGNDITNGSVDVVVTDGFTGNVALKTAEGVGKFISGVIKQEFGSSILAKIGYLFAFSALKKAKKRMDPREYNGALFLGLNNICIKSHGSADAYAFSRAVMVGADMVQHGFNKMVAEQIEKLGNQEAFITMSMDPVPAASNG